LLANTGLLGLLVSACRSIDALSCTPRSIEAEVGVSETDLNLRDGESGWDTVARLRLVQRQWYFHALAIEFDGMWIHSSFNFNVRGFVGAKLCAEAWATLPGVCARAMSCRTFYHGSSTVNVGKTQASASQNRCRRSGDRQSHKHVLDLFKFAGQTRQGHSTLLVVQPGRSENS
jgi:hypothetical protein